MTRGPGTPYGGSIKRTRADALIEESSERPDPAMDDERRRHYRLTDLGRRALPAELQRNREIVSLAQQRQLFLDLQAVAAL